MDPALIQDIFQIKDLRTFRETALKVFYYLFHAFFICAKVICNGNCCNYVFKIMAALYFSAIPGAC